MLSSLLRDAVGQRGEAIFYVCITRLYGRERPLFRPQFLGDKWPTVDYIVELNEPSGTITPYFFAQVRATRLGYTQREKRLKVQISRAEISKLASLPAPTYVIGVDEIAEIGYIISVNAQRSRGLTSISTQFPITQTTQELLQNEVASFWAEVDTTQVSSHFVDANWR